MVGQGDRPCRERVRRVRAPEVPHRSVGAATPDAATPQRPLAIDSLSPAAFSPSSPTDDATFAAAPKFSWTEAVDASSGTTGYELWAHYGGADHKIATTTGPKATDTTLDPGIAAQLPLNTDIDWWVKAFDLAGNPARESGHRSFKIDPTIPGPATFTSGPGAQTNDTTPSFAWTGNQPSFEWAVIPAGTNTLLQQGSGMSTQVTLGTLPQGDYTFRVVQVSAGGGRERGGHVSLHARHHAPGASGHRHAADQRQQGHHPGVLVAR